MTAPRIYARDADAIKAIMSAFEKLTHEAGDDYYVSAHTDEGVRLWHCDGYSLGVFLLEDDDWFFQPSYKEAS